MIRLSVFPAQEELENEETYQLWYSGTDAPVLVLKDFALHLSHFAQDYGSEAQGPFFEFARNGIRRETGMVVLSPIGPEIAEILRHSRVQSALKLLPPDCEIICRKDEAWSRYTAPHYIYRMYVRIPHHQNAQEFLWPMLGFTEVLLDMLAEQGFIHPK